MYSYIWDSLYVNLLAGVGSTILLLSTLLLKI